jgi:hypothetical protein
MMGAYDPAQIGQYSFLSQPSLASGMAPVDMSSSLMQMPQISAGGGAGGIGAAMGGPMGIANAAISGLQALGSLWMAHKQMKLAKKQFKFTKDVTNINLNNQMQSYNTALADRARSRGVMEGQTPDQVAGYISANQLTRSQGKNNGYSPSGVSAAALSNYSDYLGRGTSGYTGGSSSSSSSSGTGQAVRDEEKTNG